jgi:hypothetical protein
VSRRKPTVGAQQPDPVEQVVPLDLRVQSGTPTPEELAAIVAVLQAVAAQPAARPAPTAPRPSRWVSQRDLRVPLPDTWS